MKKIQIISFIFILGIFFFACDEIEKPYLPTDGEIPVTVTFPELTPDNLYRKVLIEEYTGHKCTNCPTGHAKLDEMFGLYGDTIVAIGVHAGPLAATDEQFPYNFVTPQGVQLFNDFNIPQIPLAIMSRVRYNANSWGSPINKWVDHFNKVDRSTNYAAIQLINEYNAATQTITTFAKVSILEEIAHRVQFCVVVTENGIVKPQLNNGVIVPNYTHNHVLRGTLNGNYGVRLTNDGLVAKGDTYLKGYQVSLRDKDWVASNCSIVAYLIDMETKEIIQATEVKVQ